MRRARDVAALAAVTILVAGPMRAPAHAQTFGPKAGVTRSMISFARDPAPVDARAGGGFLAGGFVAFPLGGRLTIGADVLLVQRRAYFADSPESPVAFTDTLRHIEIPLAVRYRLFDVGGVAISAEGGISVAWLVTARQTYAGGDDDISEAIESREVAAVVGAAADWRRLVFGVRYAHGVSDVYPPEAFPARQRTLQIAVGFRLREP